MNLLTPPHTSLLFIPSLLFFRSSHLTPHFPNFPLVTPHFPQRMQQDARSMLPHCTATEQQRLLLQEQETARRLSHMGNLTAGNIASYGQALPTIEINRVGKKRKMVESPGQPIKTEPGGKGQAEHGNESILFTLFYHSFCCFVFISLGLISVKCFFFTWVTNKVCDLYIFSFTFCFDYSTID